MSVPPTMYQLVTGTVIDHLPVGSSARALALLGLPREGPVTVGMNVPSARLGAKDIIRIEGLRLDKGERDRLALLGRTVTVSFVEGGAVSEKARLEVPEELVGVLTCRNQTCITRTECLVSRFTRVGAFPYRFRCHYCERVQDAET